MELSDRFTFKVDGWNFMPAAKFGWDGTIRLFDLKKGLLYAGLREKVKEFCEENSYQYIDETEVLTRAYERHETVLEPHDYQLRTVETCLGSGRRLVLSPTGSGKSLVIYMLLQQYSELRALIIVPTIQLVSQMEGDFESYGCREPIHGIYGGKEKDSNARIVVSTWQSIAKATPQWLAQFPVIIVDEAHTAAAKSITSIMEKAVKSPYKFGFTGTLNDSKTNKMVLEGLFGSVYKATSTAELIEKKTLSELDITAVLLDYEDQDKKVGSKLAYSDEMSFLVDHPKRMRVIRDMVLAAKGPSLVLFNYVRHGKAIYEEVQKKTDRPVYLIHGSVDVMEREMARAAVAAGDPIVIASFGTTQAGVNMPRIRNLFFCSPTKSKIRNLQSVGRGLRKADGKINCRLIDIGDDLRWKSRINHTLKHFNERLKTYSTEGFDYKILRIQMSKVNVL